MTSPTISGYGGEQVKANIEVVASSVEVTTGTYSTEVKICINQVEINSVLDEIGQESIFEWSDLSDYVDWAEAKDKVSEILDRLSLDEVISWLRDNGHLEDKE